MAVEVNPFDRSTYGKEAQEAAEKEKSLEQVAFEAIEMSRLHAAQLLSAIDVLVNGSPYVNIKLSEEDALKLVSAVWRATF